MESVVFPVIAVKGGPEVLGVGDGFEENICGLVFVRRDAFILDTVHIKVLDHLVDILERVA